MDQQHNFIRFEPLVTTCSQPVELRRGAAISFDGMCSRYVKSYLWGASGAKPRNIG